MIADVKRWSGLPKAVCLSRLGVGSSSYYRWRRRSFEPPFPFEGARPPQPHSVLPEERDAVIDYAKLHPNPRHRELAWKMVDDDVACLSPSTVYRILRDEGLICSWPKKHTKRYREEDEKAGGPDQRWQSDLRYIKVNGRTYYLVIFLDEYSRYVVHHDLMCYLDGDTLSLEAQRAIEKLGEGRRPIIQTDNGSNYISGEFKKVLDAHKLSHVRIMPHCPEQNGLVERTHRTLGEVLDEIDLRDLEHARSVISDIIRWYNQERLHSSLHFLRPVDYYRGNVEMLLEVRRKKLADARQLRKEKNLKIRQKTFNFQNNNQETKHSLIINKFCPTC